MSKHKVNQIVEATLHTTPEAVTHWRSRMIAKAQGVSQSMICRIRDAHGLQFIIWGWPKHWERVRHEISSSFSFCSFADKVGRVHQTVEVVFSNPITKLFGTKKRARTQGDLERSDRLKFIHVVISPFAFKKCPTAKWSAHASCFPKHDTPSSSDGQELDRFTNRRSLLY